MRKPFLMVILFVTAPAALADETPRTGVIDRVGVMRANESSRLNAWLLELEQKTGAQLKVLIVPTTGDQDIYQYSIDTARKWRLGQRDKDNGALVVIAVNDRKWHVQVGEGIEDALPDLLVDKIAQEKFVPNFRKGDFSQGIYLGTIEMARAIATDSGAQLEGLPARSAQRAKRSRSRDGGSPAMGIGSTCCVMVAPMFVVLVLFGSILAGSRRMHRGSWAMGRRRRGFSPGNFLAGMLLANMLGGGRGGGRSGWGGGGFGGGGFGGGFGGGGGGSFGGGGAGGSW